MAKDDKRLAELEAAYAKQTDELRKAKKEFSQQLAAFKDAAEQEIERLRTGRGGIGSITPQSVLNAAKRAEMKEATLKEGEGENEVALFFIPENGEPFVDTRRGVVVQPGNVVRLPIDHDPSIHWEAVAEKGKAKVFAPADLEPASMSEINNKATAAADKRMADMTKI